MKNFPAKVCWRSGNDTYFQVATKFIHMCDDGLIITYSLCLWQMGRKRKTMESEEEPACAAKRPFRKGKPKTARKTTTSWKVTSPRTIR